MFQYRTRGNTSPHGKRRVYFTCHPEDFNLFFDSISDEILEISNCAIWYSRNDYYEDAETDLGQMNVFVVPITTRLLSTPSRTVQIDMPFAIEHNIPLLPLMQESKLRTLYSRQFGDLQYLDKKSTDDTAIPYERKVQKFLSSVLTEDEQATRIRAEFGASVFLSYRKKDRKYANELMKQIHKYELCQDIAIWYDEYLVPGEHFNEAISEAINLCDIFALAVTPNLVNEINYVCTIEYPTAVEKEKPILPIEMEKTDPAELGKKFPGIPQTIDGQNSMEISTAVLNCLGNIQRERKSNASEHDYLIGLAYLDGIDVEIDRKKALALIQNAANHCHPEAMQKLAFMFREGYGVKRDYNQSLHWQKSLIAYWERLYQNDKNEDLYKQLHSSVWELGDFQFSIRDLSSAEDAFNKMVKLSHQFGDELTGTARTKSELSVAYGKLGDIYHIRGDLDRAEEYYQKCFAIDEVLMEELGTTDAMRNLASSFDRLGNIYLKRGSLEKAQSYFFESLHLDEAIAKESNTIENLRCLAIGYDRQGELYQVCGNLDRAEHFYSKGFALSKQIAEESRSVDARNELSISYERLGDVCLAYGDIIGAETNFQKSKALRESLVKETASVQDRSNLSNSFIKLGDIYLAQGNLKCAEEYYQKGCDIDKLLVQETEGLESTPRCLSHFSPVSTATPLCKNGRI